MRLFILKSNNIALDHTEILLYPELKAILDRDKSTDKHVAYNEFKFIYFMCDPKAYPQTEGFTTKQAFTYAIHQCGFKEDYSPDEDLKSAMSLYENSSTSVATTLRKEMIASMKISIGIVTKFRQMIESKLALPDLKPEDLDILVNSLSKLVSISHEFPKQLDILAKAEATIKEEDKADIGRGGGEILDSMDPDKSLG